MHPPRSTHAIENVGDYPRPPRVEAANQRARIWVGDALICDAPSVVRVLETFHPPGIYLSPSAFVDGALQPARDSRTTYCEFKGVATYLGVHAAGGLVLERAAWTYASPTAGYEAIAGLIAVYPGLMTRCELDDEPVTAQPGDFYGGWTTSWIEGPIKGAPGTTHW